MSGGHRESRRGKKGNRHDVTARKGAHWLDQDQCQQWTDWINGNHCSGSQEEHICKTFCFLNWIVTITRGAQRGFEVQQLNMDLTFLYLQGQYEASAELRCRGQHKLHKFNPKTKSFSLFKESTPQKESCCQFRSQTVRN